MNNLIIGGHVSVAGGLHNAIKKGVEEEFSALQIFVSAPQSFRVTNYSDEQKTLFVEEYKKAGFTFLVQHAIYLINLVSDNTRLVQLSKESLLGYLKIGSEIGSIGTIVHLGSYKNGSFAGCEQQLYTVINEITSQMAKNQFVIVENSAGGGGKIPASLEEMASIWKNCDQDKIRFCLDTQHLFAAGIDVADYGEFEDFLHRFDESIGIKNVICVHANDSKSELGSGHDRHENIGEGFIGDTGFKNILSQRLIQNIPLILEVPGVNRGGPNKENKDRLKLMLLNK